MGKKSGRSKFEGRRCGGWGEFSWVFGAIWGIKLDGKSLFYVAENAAFFLKILKILKKSA